MDNLVISRSNHDTVSLKFNIITQSTCPEDAGKESENLLYDTGTHTWYNTLEGFKNPNWRDQVRSHVNATTPLVASSTHVTGSQTFLEREEDRYCYYDISVPTGKTKSLIYGWFAPALFLGQLSDYDETVVNEAAARFYQQASDALTPVKGQVILAELKETVHLLRHPLNGIKRLLKEHSDRSIRAKKPLAGKVGIPQGARGAIRESWLETVFGWLPLARDVQDVVNYLVKRHDSLRQEYQDLRGKSFSETVTETWNPGNAPSAYYNQSYRIVTRVSFECRQVGQVRLAVGDGMSQTARELGLPPTQFIPTLWNIIPYSFVADYFTNIGKVLDAYSVPSSSIAWVSRTCRRMTTSASSGTPSPSWKGNCGQVVVTTKDVVRSAPPNLGLPSFDWDPKFGLKRTLNVVALLDGIVSRHSRPF